MKQWLIGVFALLLIAPVLAVPPAPPRFERLGVADGLPSSVVYTLEQDRDGFIWVGSADGLARYDGVGFRTWRHDPDDAGSLASNDVAALLVDRSGRLWCGGEASGVSQLLADGSFRRYRHAPDEPDSLGSDDVWTIAEDAAGQVWVGTYLGGLNRLREDGRFERVLHDAVNPDSLRSNTVLVLHGDADGRLWVGTDVGLDVREADGRIVHVALPPFEAAGKGLMITGFMADDDGSVLVGTRKGIARVGADLQFIEEVAAELPKSNVMAMVRDEDSSLWIGAQTGLTRIDAEGEHRYGAIEPMPGDLPGTRVMDILRDHEGGLWFALYDGGIARLPAHWRNFSVWRHLPGEPASLLHNRTQGIGVDPAGGVWVSSSRDGLDHIDSHGLVVRHGARLRATSEHLRAVLPLGDALWVGHQRGLRRYQPSSAEMIELPVSSDDEHALPRGYVDRLLASADGSVWASVRGGGIARIDPHTQFITRYTPAQKTLADADVVALMLDVDGLPWVAGASGVERYDVANDRFVPLPGVPSGPVHALALIDAESFWLHRLGALEQYSVRDGQAELVQRFTAADGWPTMTAGDMHVAGDDSLWVTSLRGLWRVDAAQKSIRHFGERDGLPSQEFILGSFAVGKDGVVYAGTLGGVVGFDPARIRLASAPPPLRLTGLAFRRGADVLQPDPAVPLTLRHDDRDLSVQLRALSFLNPTANRYRFQLQGFDQSWVDADARGERVFSQLPAGEYTLRARGANAVGAWTDLDPPLSFRVAPAPWATPWAYLLYVLMAALIAWLVFRSWRERVERSHVLALNQEQRRNAERLAAAKSTFLATMSHEIRTPMTGVLGMTELLKRTELDQRQRGYADAIDRSGALMLRLVNDSLDLARIDAGKLALDVQPFDPVQLVQEVLTLQRPLALRKGLELKLEVDPNTPRLLHGDALRIQQILLNLSGNALKFTEQGAVTLRISAGNQGGLRVEVSDTGPGISSAMRETIFQRFEQSDGVSRRFGGSGLGLAICQELADLMGGRIEVDSTVGEGSHFSVDLPLPLASAPQSTMVAPADDVRARSLCVLVVEDDLIVADVLVGLLAAGGHRGIHAPHGLGALAELEQDGVDLALLDLDLPGVDGLQLARMIRNREAMSGRHLPLIAITARTGGDEEDQAKAAGMDGFVRKPISGASLRAALAPWVGTAQD